MDLCYQLATHIGKLTADLQGYAGGDASNNGVLRKALADANIALSTGANPDSVGPTLSQALGMMPLTHPLRDRLFRINAALMAIRAAQAVVIVAAQ